MFLAVLLITNTICPVGSQRTLVAIYSLCLLTSWWIGNSYTAHRKAALGDLIITHNSIERARQALTRKGVTGAGEPARLLKAAETHFDLANKAYQSEGIGALWLMCGLSPYNDVVEHSRKAGKLAWAAELALAP